MGDTGGADHAMAQGPERLAAARRVAAEARRGMPQLEGPHRSSRENENFVPEFFNASRLHFIGSWKDRFQGILSSLPPPPPLPPVRPGGERCIAHIDMDCFFASVAMRGRPALKGMAVAVAWSDGQAEIASCNYAARACGLSNGMWVARAKELCPSLVVMPYQFEEYESIAEQMYRSVFGVTPHVMGVSVDECYADLTGVSDPDAAAAALRQEIHTQTGCTASIGIGPNRLLARLATKRAKPDGLFKLRLADGRAMLAEEAVSALPGVGYHMREKLEAIGVHTCGDLQAIDPGRLRDTIGPKHSTTLREYASAVDKRPWEPRPMRKSIGAQSSWGVRFATATEAAAFANKLSSEVASRLTKQGMRGAKLTLTLWRAKEGADSGLRKGSMGHGACDHISRSLTLPSATAEAALIGREVTKMLNEVCIPADRLRGMGISLSKLCDECNATSGQGCSAGAGARLLPARVAAAPPASRYIPGESIWEKWHAAAAPAAKAGPSRMAGSRTSDDPQLRDQPRKVARLDTNASHSTCVPAAISPQHSLLYAEPVSRDLGLCTRTALLDALEAMKDTMRITYSAALLPLANSPARDCPNDADHATKLLRQMCESLLAAQTGSNTNRKHGVRETPSKHCDGLKPVDTVSAVQALLKFARELGGSSLTYAAADHEMTSGFQSARIVAWLDACDRIESDALLQACAYGHT